MVYRSKVIAVADRYPESRSREALFHVGVEAIQVEERGFEAPRLRIAVGHGDDFREVTHLLEELLPLRDKLILRILDEHFLPPDRKRRSIVNGHISFSPPSSGTSTSREYR